MLEDPAAAAAARVLNACWHVRMTSRPHQVRSGDRARLLAALASIVVAGLAAPGATEAVLYALAIGLYERGDPRFT